MPSRVVGRDDMSRPARCCVNYLWRCGGCACRGRALASPHGGDGDY